MSKEIFGEESSQYANALFLKAKSLIMSEKQDSLVAPVSRAPLEPILKAIEIEEKLQSNQ